MFRSDIVPLLCCPSCKGESLRQAIFEGTPSGDILDGVLWCAECLGWYPIEEGVLDLLVGRLAYHEDRSRFWKAHTAALRELGLTADMPPSTTEADLQAKQQRHFDWYAANEKQTYLAYEAMPFWVAADAIAFSGWRQQIQPGRWLLEVGCGQGRSAFKLADLDIRIVAFDVSKEMVRQAVGRYREGRFAARATFFVADASRFPIKSACMDYVLVYGVLHHVPDPRAACLEVARVLKPGGVYFGSENNHSVFRAAFDVLQKVFPIWYEEAGPEALISARTMEEGFRGTGVDLGTHTSVFLPPHLINLLPRGLGLPLLRLTDRVCAAVPGLSRNGGLILIEGLKRS